MVFGYNHLKSKRSCGSFVCSECNKTFERAQSLAVHRYKAHGIHSAERAYVFGSVCVACSREFWSTDRVQNHLRFRSNGCYTWLVKNVEPAKDFQAVQMPKHLAGVKRLPCVSTDAKPDGVNARDDVAATRAQLDAACGRLFDAGVPRETDAELEAELGGKLRAVAKHWYNETSKERDDLLGAWIDAMEAPRERHMEVLNAFMAWGESELQQVTRVWNDGLRPAVAESVFVELARESELYQLRSSIRQLRCKLQAQENPDFDKVWSKPKKVARQKRSLQTVESRYLKQDEVVAA